MCCDVIRCAKLQKLQHLQNANVATTRCPGGHILRTSQLRQCQAPRTRSIPKLILITFFIVFVDFNDLINDHVISNAYSSNFQNGVNECFGNRFLTSMVFNGNIID